MALRYRLTMAAQHFKVMDEKHVLVSRVRMDADPVKVREFATYRAAIIAGMREFGHGRYWVDSFFRDTGTRWTGFSPEPVHLSDLSGEGFE